MNIPAFYPSKDVLRTRIDHPFHIAQKQMDAHPRQILALEGYAAGQFLQQIAPESGPCRSALFQWRFPEQRSDITILLPPPSERMIVGAFGGPMHGQTIDFGILDFRRPPIGPGAYWAGLEEWYRSAWLTRLNDKAKVVAVCDAKDVEACTELVSTDGGQWLTRTCVQEGR